ncbi:hypothetical protein [Piscicoccus intestinalis]|uniref:hypothetical protein n=1 Tax=Piscicoccus intestinalis TaxID=746033 RepID=UPI00083842F9|nr:hypothetical protein [Piscicoccus intestinalis]
MSDLQCPVTFYVRSPRTAGADDEADERLPVADDEVRIALVYAAPTRALAAERLAESLGCAVRVEDSLDDEVLPALHELADLHRGESVVVLPAAEVPTRSAFPWVRVRIDGDGTSIAPLTDGQPG